jgi:hypothetical protein
MDPNRNRYLSSISAELRTQATRIRDLIGDKHWLSDGHHKEYLVKSVLGRHVPSGVCVDRGFVAHPRRPDLVSREQDLLFVDASALQPVFHQGGLCIAFPQHVMAAIAVKTTLAKKELEDACETIRSLRRVCSYAGLRSSPWCGILFFEPSGLPETAICQWMGEVLQSFADEEPLESASLPDLIAVGTTGGFIVDARSSAGAPFVIRGFDGDGIVLLLHGLLTQIASARGSNSAELEAFFSGFAMAPLPGSPFVSKTSHGS